MNIRRVRLEEIHNDPANARIHDARNLDAITASLKTFGQCEPLVVQRGAGKVIAGNGRLTAMRALGWTECEVVEVEFDDLKSCALGIAMNRASELGGWNDGALATLLDELRREDQLDGVGFSDNEIDKLLAEMADNTPADVDDPGPQAPLDKAVSKLGDLWTLGEHRLLVGDSTNTNDVARVLGGEKSKLLSSDPPYCVGYSGNDRPSKDGSSTSGKDWSALYHETDSEGAADFYDRFLTACLPHIVENVGVFLWHAHANYVTLAQVLDKHGIFVHQMLIWLKPTATFGHSTFRWRHEPCAYGWRRGFRPPHTAANFESV